ncbi:MAG: RNA polymerase sigma factor [Clostridiales bacterium]|nr:RNA polymerase sigma factor [Clostridiales bacterium]
MDDAQIISLLFDRSEQGLREIEKSYGEKMRGLAFRLCGNEQDTGEIVNDALLAAWNSIPPARPAPLSAYLLKIVRNLACNRVRSRNAALRRAVVLPADELADELMSDDPEDRIDPAALASALNDFLASRKKTDRLIFLKRYWFSAGISEISAQTGLSVTAVSVRLSRMKKSLSELLEKRGIRL